MDTEGQKHEQANKITDDHIQLYLFAMEAKAHQDAKECTEYIKQVTDQHNSLLTLVQEQQKRIDDLLLQSKTLMEAMAKDKPMQGQPTTAMRQSRGARNCCCKYCKTMTKHTSNNSH